MTSQIKVVEAVIPPWVAVLFAVLCSVSFCSRILLFRKITGLQGGICFNVIQVMMHSFLIPNFFVLIAAMVLWNVYEPINWYTFLMGTLGAFIDVIGLNLLYTALAKGPGGPITAICSASAILAVVIESVKAFEVPNWIQFLSLFIGLIGAVEFVVPQLIHKIFCCGKCLEK